jgi:hypothetical protein
MLTVKFQTTKAYSKEILKVLKENHKIKFVEVEEDTIQSKNLIKPRRPLTEKELVKIASEAEAETTIPFDASVRRIKKHITNFNLKQKHG